MAELPDGAASAGASEAPSREVRREGLVSLFRDVQSCEACPLSKTRTNPVFGAGNADADLLFVGEAPGAEEDRQGLPFVGRAGSLLNELLGEIGLSREDVFIANILKSRPPGNRDPQPAEIEACFPYLLRQIELIRPLVICTLGNFATRTLGEREEGITKLRGVPFSRVIAGCKVVVLPIYHPAYALRSPAAAAELGADLKLVPGLLAAASSGLA